VKTNVFFGDTFRHSLLVSVIRNVMDGYICICIYIYIYIYENIGLDMMC